MATSLALRFRSNLLRTSLFPPLLRTPPFKPSPSLFSSFCTPTSTSITTNPSSFFSLHRFLSTSRRQPLTRPKKNIDIAERARQLQARRLWTYGLAFATFAGFIVVVLNNFQDQLVFYVTPTEVIEKFKANPTKSKFRLGGLVLEGSIVYPANSPDTEFVVTDLITDIVVRYNGSLPDLFREGHSVVAEGFVKPFTDEIKKESSVKNVAAKARSGEYYFSATEVLAKHDEKYMPKEVAAAIEKNKKILEETKGVPEEKPDEKPDNAA